MAYFLVSIKFKLDDGREIKHSGWYYGEDYLEAAEHARLDRQWDLRDVMREGEFKNPEKVVEAIFTAKRYDVREHQDDHIEMHTGIGVEPELPGATREDIADLEDPIDYELGRRVLAQARPIDDEVHPWERRGDVSGYDG